MRTKSAGASTVGVLRRPRKFLDPVDAWPRWQRQARHRTTFRIVRGQGQREGLSRLVAHIDWDLYKKIMQTYRPAEVVSFNGTPAAARSDRSQSALWRSAGFLTRELNVACKIYCIASFES